MAAHDLGSGAFSALASNASACQPGANQIIYPQAGQPMLPHLLIELLKSRTIRMPDGSERALADFAAIKPDDLDPKDTQSVADAIASVVQSILYGRRQSQLLSQIRIEVPCRVTLRDLPLSSRVRVALQSRPFFDANGPWRSCSLANMICEQSLGAKLLLSFLLALEEGMRKDQAAKTRSTEYLEDDLARIVSESIYAPRSADVFMRATGWDGMPKESLVQIASRHGISKERARQIFVLANHSIERHLRSSPDAPARLEMAFHLLYEHAPLSAKQASELLRDHEVSRGAFDIIALVGVSQTFAMPHHLEFECIGEGQEEILIREDDKRKVREIMSAAKAMLRAHGLVCMSWLGQSRGARDESTQSTRLMSSQALELVLEKGMGLVKLDVDHQHQWYWQAPRDDERPQGIIIKAMKAVAFFGSVPWSRLSERLIEKTTKRAGGATHAEPSIDPQVLAAVMLGWGLHIDTQGNLAPMSTQAMQRCQATLPPVEAQLGKLIADAGGKLARSQFLHHAGAAGIKPNTALTYLKSSSLLRSRTGHSDPWVELLCGFGR